MALCSKCETNQAYANQKWCAECFKTYQTDYRVTRESRLKKRGREEFRRELITAFSTIEGYVAVSKVMEVISRIE